MREENVADFRFPPFVRGVLETLGVLILFVFAGLGWAEFIESAAGATREVQIDPMLERWPLKPTHGNWMKHAKPRESQAPEVNPASGSWTATTSSTLDCSAATEPNGGRRSAGTSCSTWRRASMPLTRRSGWFSMGPILQRKGEQIQRKDEQRKDVPVATPRCPRAYTACLPPQLTTGCSRASRPSETLPLSWSSRRIERSPTERGTAARQSFTHVCFWSGARSEQFDGLTGPSSATHRPVTGA